MNRVMTYTRITGTDYLLGEPSLSTQFDACQEYADRQPDWQITKEVSVIWEKPQLDDAPLGNLYERIRNQEIDILLVSSLDRLSPNEEVLRHLYQHCKRSRVILDSVTEVVDSMLGGGVLED